MQFWQVSEVMEVADKDRFLRAIMFVFEKKRAHMGNEKTFITHSPRYFPSNK